VVRSREEWGGKASGATGFDKGEKKIRDLFRRFRGLKKGGWWGKTREKDKRAY